MLWVPEKGDLRVEHNTGGVGSTTPGSSVTTGAASSTKGTPVALFASTAFDAYWIAIYASLYGASAVASAGCLDILTGAATEEVLIPNLLMGYCGGSHASASVNTLGGKIWEFPLYIPAGSRIAAQVAGARLSTAMRVAVYLYGGDGVPPFRVGSKITTYGIGTVPNGTTIVPGASGAEGSWTEIVASTTEDHFAWFPSLQVQGDTTISPWKNIAVDIGEGAATEEMIGEGFWYPLDQLESMGGPWPSMPVFKDVPSGTRMTMRASASGGVDSQYGAALHAVS